MTKQEHIEEMISAMAASNNPFVDVPIEIMPKVAEALYNAGYRKVSADTLILTENQLKKIIEEEYKKALKGKVVLTTEEYQDLVVKSMDNFSSAMVKARKETAEKILDLLVPDCKACDENWHNGCLCLRATLAEKIAKQFGLEIKEYEK